MKFNILAIPMSFWEAFLCIILTWSLNVSDESIHPRTQNLCSFSIRRARRFSLRANQGPGTHVERNGQFKNNFDSRTKVSFVSNKGSFVFKSLCKYCIVLDTHKGLMTSNDVREECLEFHMTSNDVKGECHITIMTGRCVNKPDWFEPVGCYENKFISNFAKCM